MGLISRVSSRTYRRDHLLTNLHLLYKKMAHLSSLANGIKVATINNGLQAARVGVYSASGSVNESMGHVGKMNLLSNALNATGLVSAKTQKDMTQVNAQDLNAKAALGKIKSALHSDFSATIDSARVASNNQAIAFVADVEASFGGFKQAYHAGGAQSQLFTGSIFEHR